MKQLTKKQAIEIAESEIWKEWTAEEVVRFQLFQDRLCMEFGYFQKCIEEVLGRPVYTHEFAGRDDLIREYLGDKEPPTLEEIINLIPKEKLVIITTTDIDESLN